MSTEITSQEVISRSINVIQWMMVGNVYVSEQRKRTKRRFGTILGTFCGLLWITLMILYGYINLLTFNISTVRSSTTKTSSSSFNDVSYVEEQLHRNFGPTDNKYNNKKNTNREDDDNNESFYTNNLRQGDAAETCLTDECIQQVASTIARAFPVRTDKSSWCRNSYDDHEENGDEMLESGIILIKVTKAASSTSAGVAIRIATRHNCSNIQWRHRLANEVQYIPTKTFLMTTIREPASRAVSTIFFHTLSRQKSGPKFVITDNMVLQQLQTLTHNHYGAISAGQGGFQLRYIYPHGHITEYSAWTPIRPGRVVNASTVIENVRKTIETYDFILLPERMDESLVAMALLLQIDVGDVLVTSSKVAGTSQYHLLHPNKRTFHCLATRSSYVTPVVARFLQSNQWRAMNYGDYVLYEVVQQSLDRTIHDTIGLERFQAALQRYRTLKQLEQVHCAPHVQFPCSNDGVPQLNVAKENCYLFYFDFGCGYPCIDNIIQQYDSGMSLES
jgi:hypothetical protein